MKYNWLQFGLSKLCIELKIKIVYKAISVRIVNLLQTHIYIYVLPTKFCFLPGDFPFSMGPTSISIAKIIYGLLPISSFKEFLPFGLFVIKFFVVPYIVWKKWYYRFSARTRYGIPSAVEIYENQIFNGNIFTFHWRKQFVLICQKI